MFYTVLFICLFSCIPYKEFRLQFQNSETVQIYMCAHGFIVHVFEGNSGFTATLLGELDVLLGYATNLHLENNCSLHPIQFL